MRRGVFGRFLGVADQHDFGRAWPPEAGLLVGGHEALVTKGSEKRQLKFA